MDAKSVLIQQLETNFMLVNKNITDITHEDSLRFPQDASNPMNWILGHLVFSRNILLCMLGERPLWDNFTAYDRGYNAKDTKDQFKNFEQLQLLFGESQKRLSRVLGDFDTLPEDVQKDVSILALHEIYHCGQLGYMRRLLGKEGVIK